MSDGPTTRSRRITISYFRTCSTCLSCSQAPLCDCTQLLMADPDNGPGLEAQNNQGSISRATPPEPESRLQSLLPILRKLPQAPISSCSKGPRVFPSFRG